MKAKSIIIVSVDSPFKKVKVGGKHIHILNFYRALKREGYAVRVITIDKKIKHSDLSLLITYLKNLIKFKSINLFDKNIQFLSLIEYLVKQLSDKLKEIKLTEDTIVIAEDVPSLVAAKQIKHKYIFGVIHGYFTYESLNYKSLANHGRIGIRFFKDYEKKAYSYARAIVCVDSAIKEYLSREMNYNHTTVIYNSIETSKLSVSFEQKKIYKNKLLTKLEINKKESIIILVPRRLVKKNGVIYAVRAMHTISVRNPAIFDRTYLLIAGDGPEKNNIQKEINSEHILLLGKVDHEEIINIFKGSDIVLIPSIYSDNFAEATSLAALEGMASRCLTIVSNVGGLKEIVTNKRGIVVNEKSPLQIAETIISYANNYNKYKKIINEGYKYVNENHNYVNHAKKILEFIISQMHEKS